jgi:NADH-quinone oxidoreductase subunit M
MRQRNLNLLIGNSSVAHMGFIFLGIASLNLIGLTGAVLIMVAHGFLAALSFGLSGYLYSKAGTLEMSELGGLCRKLPFIGTALLMAAMAGCGLPGFANFAGEVTVFFGVWSRPALHLTTVLAVWGALVIGGVYMTRMVRQVLHGPLPERWHQLPDAANLWRRLPYVLLLAGLLVFGCWPKLLTDKIAHDMKPLISGVETVAGNSTSFSDRTMDMERGRLFPLTPALSLGERENDPPTQGKTMIPDVVEHKFTVSEFTLNTPD